MKFLLLSKERHHHIILFLSNKGNVQWKKDRLSKKEITQYDWIISYGYQHIIFQN